MSLRSQVEGQWSNWCKQAEEADIRIPDEPIVLESLLQVWEASSYVVQSCHRDMGLLPELIGSGHLGASYLGEELSRQLADWLADVQDDVTLGKKLRLFRRYQMVRIIWRDIAGWAPLAETLEDLSALADACIGGALDRLYAWTRTELGTPRNKAGDVQSLVVIGMGKLGARELNLSSDIDLIFAYPEAGQTDGERSKTNEQFFIRLSQRMVQALDSVNADGFVFRVDTRLRPYGNAGPLAMSFDAMEGYYESQAREWERYAMIKARVVAGEEATGARLIQMLRPFVYRRYLDYGAIESLREMKQLISRELHKKGMDANVKLGSGGIREIEFIGQAFQLIRGGRDKALQIRSILPVLKLLEARDILPEYVAKELIQAYEFLRLVENRIQAWADKQTHLLPGDDEGRLRLARSMRFSDWQGFSTELERHRQNVQCHFDMLFTAPQAGGDEDAQLLTAVWQDTLDRDDALEALFNAGFSDAADALRQLEQFRGSHACRALGAKGRERLNQLMPMLLEAVGQVDAAAQGRASVAGAGSTGATDVKALGRVLGLLESIARRTAYIALLVENPIALSQLVRLSGMSPWISRLLTRHPILLDELLDPRRLYSPLNRSELESELAAQLAGLDEDDLENQMERLRLFAQSNLLRVAAADITEQIPLMVVSDCLTEIAETVIARVVRLAWKQVARRHGCPPGLEEGETGLAVVGYGKLGGIELGYGSDLDMVFLHGIDNHFATTDGEKPVAVDVFYARMAQRMIHLFTTRTPMGILYEVDMRLRPNGNSGMMVSSMKAFETYQAQNAWTWEHQALVRARVVAGDARVDARFEAARREILSEPRDPQKLRAEVVEMREKMRGKLDKSKPGQFDLKQGFGGIVDIEFMVQYWVLRWVCEYPDLLGWTDNIRLLETLSRLDLLSGDTAERLMEAYRIFRAAYHRSALQDQPALADDQSLIDERELVRGFWRQTFMEEGQG
ncbi:MAG: bifunctional [glutamate--ammonia ligase]-adenylyl-L-tyrosine phosphorylase/[glutamate--ammonia-ligase] adenylyltransferase [Pseudomonadota bacterium]